jgi:hypothetical protein
MSGCVAFFETLSTDSIDLEDPTKQRENAQNFFRPALMD